MTFLIQYFWGKVLSCATERESLFTLALQKFSKSEICQVNIAWFINKNIFRFEISMHNIIIMQISKSYSHLSSIEFDDVFIEPLLEKQMVIEISSSYILKEEIDPEFVLKNIVHTQYKWMIRLEKNLLFIFSVLNLLFVN